jgi:DNA invertase Pin-like site-specific DNA recombinase
VKRAVLYMRVSSLDQHPETQLLDLRQMAAQRGYEIVQEYTDRISGAKVRRPGLDELMRDARRGRFDVVLVWASDRIARSVKHFLEVLDELNRLQIEFLSFREQIDTGGPLGRAIVVIIGAVAELERNLIIERVRAGMRRARLEGRHIGRRPLDLDRESILRDRRCGHSLGKICERSRDLPGHRAPRHPRKRNCAIGESRMTENPADFIPIWMILSAAFGFIVGDACGNSFRHRKCLQETNDELRDRLQEATADTEPIHRALKQQRGVINDIHSRLVAVSKGLEKRPS